MTDEMQLLWSSVTTAAAAAARLASAGDADWLAYDQSTITSHFA